MQCFLLLPFLLYVFCVKRIFGYFAVSALIGFNVLLTFFISMYFNAGVNIITDGGMNVSYIYFKPWCRMGAYFVGVLFGFAYWEYKNPQP